MCGAKQELLSPAQTGAGGCPGPGRAAGGGHGAARRGHGGETGQHQPPDPGRAEALCPARHHLAILHQHLQNAGQVSL